MKIQNPSFCKAIFEFEARIYFLFFRSIERTALYRPGEKKMESGFILKNRFIKLGFQKKRDLSALSTRRGPPKTHEGQLYGELEH